MKKILLAGCSALLFSTASLAAETGKNESFQLPGTFSGTVGFVSDYVLRGITQTMEQPALQANINYVVSTPVVDLYAGIWGSNVDFNDGSQATLETDISAGVRKTIDKLTLSAGIIDYVYPGADDNLNYDYVEGVVSAEYDFTVVAINASINYSPENFGKSGDATYYRAGFRAPTPINITLDGHIARQEIDNEVVFGKPDYTEWALGANYNFSGFDLKVEYIDTDLDKQDCADGCDAKAVFTVSRSF